MKEKLLLAWAVVSVVLLASILAVMLLRPTQVIEPAPPAACGGSFFPSCPAVHVIVDQMPCATIGGDSIIAWKCRSSP